MRIQTCDSSHLEMVLVLLSLTAVPPLPRSVAGMAWGHEHMLESFLLGCTLGCLLTATSAAFLESRSDKSWLHTRSWHPSSTALLPWRPSLWAAAG